MNELRGGNDLPTNTWSQYLKTSKELKHTQLNDESVLWEIRVQDSWGFEVAGKGASLLDLQAASSLGNKTQVFSTYIT